MKNILLLIGLAVLIGCNPTNAPSKNSTPLSEFHPEQKIETLGITLPQPSSPVANYVRTVQTGNLLYLSGNGPRKADGSLYVGKLGVDLNTAQGYDAARLTGINLLAVLKAELGDLKKIKRIVKVLGMVNASPDFTEHPQVINGFSDLMVDVFGSRGKHARSAVGMASLPMGIAVEIELIVEIDTAR
ncbi:MAG: RidA family protein [Flavobacteriaceae bacterium]